MSLSPPCRNEPEVSVHEAIGTARRFVPTGAGSGCWVHWTVLVYSYCWEFCVLLEPAMRLILPGTWRCKMRLFNCL